MNLISTMLLFWAGLCAMSVLAAALIVVTEMRASHPDSGGTGAVIVGAHR